MWSQDILDLTLEILLKLGYLLSPNIFQRAAESDTLTMWWLDMKAKCVNLWLKPARILSLIWAKLSGKHQNDHYYVQTQLSPVKILRLRSQNILEARILIGSQYPLSPNLLQRAESDTLTWWQDTKAKCVNLWPKPARILSYGLSLVESTKTTIIIMCRGNCHQWSYKKVSFKCDTSLSSSSQLSVA